MRHSGPLLEAGREGFMGEAVTDTQRLDWLEKHLLHLSHGRASCSADMGGKDIHGQFLNPAMKPRAIKVRSCTIREAIDEAIGEKGKP